MSDTYEINERNEVVPYTAGRRCNDTRSWRDATEMELQQRESIIQLERELAEAKEQRDKWSNLWAYLSRSCVKDIAKLERGLAEAREQRDRLADALLNLCYGIIHDKSHDMPEYLLKAKQALAAVEGGTP
jgi:predicted RNase H-like nuclease (RuvC/YqgF family)